MKRQQILTNQSFSNLTVCSFACVMFEDMMNGSGLFMNEFPKPPTEEGAEYPLYQDWIVVSPDSYEFK